MARILAAVERILAEAAHISAEVVTFGGGGHFGGGHFGGGMRGGGAHFGGAHFGGGHFGGTHFGGGGARHFGARSFGGGRSFGARSGVARSAGRTGFSGNRSFAIHNRAGGRAAFGANGNPALRQNRNAALHARAVHNALSSRSVAGALHDPRALRNPGTRARIAATAATAGWHNRRGGGWWRHGNGGYGWVGPLFWPFAYYDMYDYTMWGGYDPSFWGYGYGDIYAGLFAPYGYDDLAGYLPSGTGGNPGGAAPPLGSRAPRRTVADVR